MVGWSVCGLNRLKMLVGLCGCICVVVARRNSGGDEGMTTSLEAPSRRITRSMSRGESSIPSPLSLFCITLV